MRKEKLELFEILRDFILNDIYIFSLFIIIIIIIF